MISDAWVADYLDNTDPETRPVCRHYRTNHTGHCIECGSPVYECGDDRARVNAWNRNNHERKYAHEAQHSDYRNAMAHGR